MAMILNLPIFVQNCDRFVYYHGDGGLVEKFNIFFYLVRPTTAWVNGWLMQTVIIKTGLVDI